MSSSSSEISLPEMARLAEEVKKTGDWNKLAQVGASNEERRQEMANLLAAIGVVPTAKQLKKSQRPGVKEIMTTVVALNESKKDSGPPRKGSGEGREELLGEEDGSDGGEGDEQESEEDQGSSDNDEDGFFGSEDKATPKDRQNVGGSGSGPKPAGGNGGGEGGGKSSGPEGSPPKKGKGKAASAKKGPKGKKGKKAKPRRSGGSDASAQGGGDGQGPEMASKPMDFIDEDAEAKFEAIGAAFTAAVAAAESDPDGVSRLRDGLSMEVDGDRVRTMATVMNDDLIKSMLNLIDIVESIKKQGSQVVFENMVNTLGNMIDDTTFATSVLLRTTNAMAICAQLAAMGSVTQESPFDVYSNVEAQVSFSVGLGVTPVAVEGEDVVKIRVPWSSLAGPMKFRKGDPGTSRVFSAKESGVNSAMRLGAPMAFRRFKSGSSPWCSTYVPTSTVAECKQITMLSLCYVPVSEWVLAPLAYAAGGQAADMATLVSKSRRGGGSEGRYRFQHDWTESILNVRGLSDTPQVALYLYSQAPGKFFTTSTVTVGSQAAAVAGITADREGNPLTAGTQVFAKPDGLKGLTMPSESDLVEIAYALGFTRRIRKKFPKLQSSVKTQALETIKELSREVISADVRKVLQAFGIDYATIVTHAKGIVSASGGEAVGPAG